MTGRLANKVSIITGGARGLGEASARRFAEEGSRVAIIDVREEIGEGTAASIRAAGHQATFYRCDLTKIDAVQKCIERIDADHGRIDVLYNNAGYSEAGTVETLSEGSWDRLFDINIKAKFLVSKFVVPTMRRGGGGSIINQSSESGLVGAAFHPGYCASMGAVVQLTRAMALSHAPDKIRVNCICPGTIPTQLFEDFLQSVPDRDSVYDMLVKEHPLGLGEPVDIANAALFLASHEAKYVTGAIFSIDGGYTAK